MSFKNAWICNNYLLLRVKHAATLGTILEPTAVANLADEHLTAQLVKTPIPFTDKESLIDLGMKGFPNNESLDIYKNLYSQLPAEFVLLDPFLFLRNDLRLHHRIYKKQHLFGITVRGEFKLYDITDRFHIKEIFTTSNVKHVYFCETLIMADQSNGVAFLFNITDQKSTKIKVSFLLEFSGDYDGKRVLTRSPHSRENARMYTYVKSMKSYYPIYIPTFSPRIKLLFTNRDDLIIVRHEDSKITPAFELHTIPLELLQKKCSLSQLVFLINMRQTPQFLEDPANRAFYEKIDKDVTALYKDEAFKKTKPERDVMDEPNPKRAKTEKE
jgi:hypothetical protein